MLLYSKGILLFTDEGIKLLGIKSDSRPWTIQECYTYCNGNKDPHQNSINANKLKLKSASINKNIRSGGSDWYTDINNFREAEVSIKSKIK